MVNVHTLIKCSILLRHTTEGIDMTGSMGTWKTAVQDNVQKITKELVEKFKDAASKPQVGIVMFWDHSEGPRTIFAAVSSFCSREV